jgi:diguanylate cyclase (GGDEF)-like protein/PAS domain S-box-containing protein
VSERIQWKPGYGLPGRVLASRKPEWLEDYFADAQLPRSESAGAHGIRSSFAFPVLSGSEVVAVLEFFSFERETIDDAVLEMMADVGAALGRVFERERARNAIAASERRARLIMDTAIDPYIEIDQGGCVTSWNEQAAKIFGWERDEILGRRLSDTIIPPEHRVEHERGLRRFLDTGEGKLLRRPVRIDALHRDGRRFPVELTVWPLQTTGQWSFNAFVRDISDQVRMEEELRRLSTVDELTGLKNRREFMNLALRELGLADRLEHRSTLLFIDLDGLKEINDRSGHQEGDRAIIDVADLLVRTFRDIDLLARVGGDEFCVFQPATDEDQAAVSIARLKSAVAEFNESGKRPYKLSISIGSSTFAPDAPVSIHALMERADQAMYENKVDQRDRPRLLVVDDDGAVRRLAHRIFAKDYDVVAVPTGDKAITVALAECPDVVVMDLGLPDMSGTEVVKSLRSSDRCASVPILVLTGAGDSAVEIESLRAGVDDFVAKPFNTDVLRLRVGNLLRRPARR